MVAYARAEREDGDHIVHLNARWADYLRVLQMRGDHSAPRITYLEGVLEIMSPSESHEEIKSKIGCLVEAWCLERDVEFRTLGSWTLKDKKEDRGAEPDECWVFGLAHKAKRPDLAVEVVWTSGGINKLEVYRKLGVREVWIWELGRIRPYLLRSERYVAKSASQVLKGIDLALLASFLDRPTTSQAIRDYRAALRK